MLNKDFDQSLDAARRLLSQFGTSNDLWEANDHVNAAIAVRPHSDASWLLKAQVLSALEDDAAALAASEMAIRLAPRNAESHLVRGAILANMERYTEALSALSRAFRYLNSQDQDLVEDLYYEKAAVLDAMNRADEAIETYKAGLDRCPDSVLLRAGFEPLRRAHTRQQLRLIQGGLA